MSLGVQKHHFLQKKMKGILFVLLTSIFFSGCRDNINHEKFMSIIQKEMNFPKIVELELFCNDLAYAQKLLKTDLEIGGWIIVQKKQKQKDFNEPLISFTDKAIPFLLPRSEMEKKIGIQRVKIAEENIDKIIDIRYDNESNSIVVEYTTIYENTTPFASLSNLKELYKKTRKSHFVYLNGYFVLRKEN